MLRFLNPLNPDASESYLKKEVVYMPAFGHAKKKVCVYSTLHELCSLQPHYFAWSTAEGTAICKSKFQGCLNWPISRESKNCIPLFACSTGIFENKCWCRINFKFSYYQIFDKMYTKVIDFKNTSTCEKMLTFTRTIIYFQFYLSVLINSRQWHCHVHLKYSLEILY